MKLRDRGRENESEKKGGYICRIIHQNRKKCTKNSFQMVKIDRPTNKPNKITFEIKKKTTKSNLPFNGFNTLTVNTQAKIIIRSDAIESEETK